MAKKAVAKKTKTKVETIKAKTLFEHLKAITAGDDSEHWKNCSEEDRKTFSPYMINRFLSMNPEWIDVISELQRYTIGQLSKRDVFRLYFSIFPKGRSFFPYVKATRPVVIPERLLTILQTYWQNSKHEVKENYVMLKRTETGKQELRDIVGKFGLDDKEKRALFKECDL